MSENEKEATVAVKQKFGAGMKLGGSAYPDTTEGHLEALADWAKSTKKYVERTGAVLDLTTIHCFFRDDEDGRVVVYGCEGEDPA